MLINADVYYRILYNFYKEGLKIKSLITSNHEITIGNALLWSGIYFIVLLIAITLNITVWKNLKNNISVWLNIITIMIFSVLFFMLLMQVSSFKIELFQNFSLKGILLAIVCAILFYLLLDKCLDPILEGIFPMSEAAYKETLNSLKQFPVSSFLRVCLIAPIVEEILMRGYVLGGLQNKYGVIIALMVSSILFALLHFNLLQTLSALICGIVLGLLYINTGSLFCCILAHFLYNAISYFTMIYP